MTSNGNGQPPKLMTPGEVAALFRVDPKTVTKWAQAGKLSCIRTLGGHRRYRASDVAAVMGQPAQPAQPPRPADTAPTPPGAEDWMFIAARQGARAEAIAEVAGLSVPAVRRILRGARP